MAHALTRIAATAMVLLAAFAPCPLAAEPADAVRVARLVTNLGSTSFAERDAAYSKLEKLGPACRPQLEAALKSPDAEVRLQAERLLRRLRVAELWQPSLCDYQGHDHSVAEILAALEKATGNRMRAGDSFGKFNNGRLDLYARQKPFWELVDHVCRTTGNHIRPNYDPESGGLVVSSGDPGHFPVAYAGPLRATISSARRVFVEDFDYERFDSDTTHTFQMNFQFLWEDGFHLVAYRAQPSLTEAVTDTGQQLSTPRPTAQSWNVVGRGACTLNANLRLDPPEMAARKLSRLALSWELIAVGGMETLVVENLHLPGPYRQSSVELVLEKCEQHGNRWDIVALLQRDLDLPDPQEVLYAENRVELLDSAGKPMICRNLSGSLTERGVRLAMSFVSPQPESAPSAFKLHYPTLRAQKALGIVFTDVPLPAARPK